MNNLLISRDQALIRYRELIEIYHRDSLAFELCNGAVLQATRNDFRAFTYEENLVIVTSKLPDCNDVIVSSVGQKRAENIFQTAELLCRQSGRSVIIKNVTAELEGSLLQLGCRHYSVGEWWDKYTKYDDNSFPEQVVDVEGLSQLKGSIYASMREEMGRFAKNHLIAIKKIDRCSPDFVSMLVDSWVDDMHLRNGWDRQQLRQSHEMFYLDRPDLLHYGVYLNGTDTLVGLLVFSEISPICLGHNVLINDFKYRNIYRILMVESARIADSMGYRYMNIQGSEDTSQYVSKRRLHAEKEVYKAHLIFDGKSI